MMDDVILTADDALVSWRYEINVGPILVTLEGETTPFKILATAYYMGYKLGDATVENDGDRICINGKIDSNNKAELCIELMDSRRKLKLSAKVCVLGVCKKWETIYEIPTFNAIAVDSFLA